MSRILAYTSPARGHLYPLMAVLLQLRARGHEVHVRTLADEVPGLRALDLHAEPVDSQIESIELADYGHRTPQKARMAAVSAFVARSRYDAPDLQAAIQRVRPDSVIVDINAWGAMAAAEDWGGTWSAFCPYPLALRSPDVPPYGPGLEPAHNWIGRLRDAALRPLVSGTLERKMLPGINDVRGGLGLPALQHLDDQFRRPPLLLYMTAEPFEYARHDWPDSVVMVGPCEWEPDVEAPTWLTEIDDPIVLVTTSSEFQDDGAMIAATLEALADEPVHVVATIPSGDPAAFTVPANAHVVRFAPHGQLLDRAVCAITHAGMGATQKALGRGVPVVAVPFGRDQPEVARRVAVAGAGVRLPASKVSPARIRSAYERARSCQAGADAVAAGFRRAGGAPAAADAIEAQLLTNAGT
ncbi:MAG: hypothetical protein MUF33_08545 [Candidatus Nanopelagicales bacterium]|nr:hypothetical protein [Candidatus Nanopelagicales bacterium]